MRRVAEGQHHFDEEQTTRWVHCLADIAKDSQALILVPIVDDVRKNISICPSGDVLEEIAGLNRHPITHAFGGKQSRCIRHNMRSVEQNAARPGMMGKDGRQHVAGRSADVEPQRRLEAPGYGCRPSSR
jgi:hypothetical protein